MAVYVLMDAARIELRAMETRMGETREYACQVGVDALEREGAHALAAKFARAAQSALHRSATANAESPALRFASRGASRGR